MIEFNVNEYVSVRLTDEGRNLHRQDFDRWAEGLKLEYRPPHEDADGWSKWQAWDLMHIFGKFMGMGSRVPFETTIRIHANPAPLAFPAIDKSLTNQPKEQK